MTMKGFFSQLTAKQKAAALAYRGPENHGPARFANTCPPLKPNEVPVILPPTPYEQGWRSAELGDGAKTMPCPFAEGTPEYDAFWHGFADADDAYIHLNHQDQD